MKKKQNISGLAVSNQLPRSPKHVPRLITYFLGLTMLITVSAILGHVLGIEEEPKKTVSRVYCRHILVSAELFALLGMSIWFLMPMVEYGILE